ncbi:MAG: SDR family oxidoreductase [Sulfuricellaceae bacterium]|nr:SDR family oxidoreductase [Sulfuricellaceae bacterium]
MRVLVTGANGFIGKALCAELSQHGHVVRGATRNSVGDIGEHTDWAEALSGIDAVVHLAARVHVMRDVASDPLKAHRATNALGTQRLAQCAAASGVKRFVYISTVKVHGEATPQRPFADREPPNPQDPYAISKFEAEQALQRISAARGMEIVILRPPLVYGPGVEGNFLRLLHLVEKGIPLPLGSIMNQRSLIYLGNLVDAIRLCLTHECAAEKTFLVSDGETISTPGLIRKLASLSGKRARLWPIPIALLQWAGYLTGKIETVQRLTDSLIVDDSAIRLELGWQPPYSMEEGLAETVRHFQATR